MLFNSLAFILFGALFFAGWPYARRTDTRRWVYMVVASFFFYGWWDWRYLSLLLFSGLIDFFAGWAMESRPRQKKLWLVLSLLGNLGTLGVFKYLGFAIGNVNSVAAALGFSPPLSVPELVLPVGISFYTFQSMSYTIDIYRGSLQPTRNIFHFFAYLSLFPQLVAGPIERASNLLPQLKGVPHTSEAQQWAGVKLIAIGFFKKVAIADSLAEAVNTAFGLQDLNPAASYWWLIVSMFAMQIYCDFSGYSDIARGLAKWMGYEFMVNFNHPYHARSLREFWSRWHISLSTWFRDYVYIPLGGSRGSQVQNYRNLLVTMMVSGLWHGAAWTFVVWGAIHGVVLTAEKALRLPERMKILGPAAGIAGWAFTMVVVWIGWVFFRATSLKQAVAIIARMFDFRTILDSASAAASSPRAPAFLAIGVAMEAFFLPGVRAWLTMVLRPPQLLKEAAVAGLLAASIFLRGQRSAFIYFQF